MAQNSADCLGHYDALKTTVLSLQPDLRLLTVLGLATVVKVAVVASIEEEDKKRKQMSQNKISHR